MSDEKKEPEDLADDIVNLSRLIWKEGIHARVEIEQLKYELLIALNLFPEMFSVRLMFPDKGRRWSLRVLSRLSGEQVAQFGPF